MKVVCKWLLLGAALACSSVAVAQDGNNSSYYLSNLPQRVRLNPAYQPEYKAWVGLPVLSGVSFNYLNTSFGISDVIRKRRLNDSLYVDMDRFYSKLKNHNTIYLNNENALLTVGVKVKSWYVTLDVTQKNDFAMELEKGLFTFLKDGNTPYIGKRMDLGGIGLRGSVYSEVALGLSKKVNDKLTVGGRFKYLIGVGNIDVKESNISIESSDADGTIRLGSQQDIRFSAPVNMTYTKSGPYINWDDIDFNTDDIAFSDIISTKNSGFGVDLGAEYKFNDKINFYASVLDLGYIRWAQNNYNFRQNAEFDWQGADISNSLNKDDPNYRDIGDAFEDLTDSLKDHFRLTEESGAYTTMLTTKMYLGASYQYNKMLSFGGITKFSILGKRFYPSFIASANARLLRNVSASVSYGIMPGHYTDLGLALTAKLGPVQLYAATDNVLAANYTSTQAVSARFGINLLFGHVDKKKKAKKSKQQEPLPVAPPAEVKKDTVVETAAAAAPTTEPAKNEATEVLQAEAPQVVATESRLTDENYYVIIGSFRNERSADRQAKGFAKDGFPETRVLAGGNGMYRVSLMSFKNQEEAETAVGWIKGKYPRHADIWVLEKATETKVF